MSKLHRLARSVSPQEVRKHLLRNELQVPEGINWEEPAEDFPARLTAAIDQTSEAKRTRFLAEVDRISDMTDEVGQAALLQLPDWREALSKIDGAHQRAYWLYLEVPEAFRQAEEIRFADENQNAQRLWDAFVGPRRLELRDDPETIRQFSEALREVLGAGRIHVEIFGRIRHRSSEPDGEIRQITLYSEDVPVDEVVFAEPGIKNVARKPVRETAIVYEPQSGTIEVVGRVREVRQQVAALFAQMLLGHVLSGRRLPPRYVNLRPLLDPIDLAVEPQDGITQAKLTELAISSTDGVLAQTFAVPFADPETLHEVLEEEYGAANPLRVVQKPWRARIEFQFEPEPGRKRGRKINAILSAPSKLNLRGKTDKERLVVDKYLRGWGLVA